MRVHNFNLVESLTEARLIRSHQRMLSLDVSQYASRYLMLAYYVPWQVMIPSIAIAIFCLSPAVSFIQRMCPHLCTNNSSSISVLTLQPFTILPPPPSPFKLMELSLPAFCWLPLIPLRLLAWSCSLGAFFSILLLLIQSVERRKWVESFGKASGRAKRCHVKRAKCLLSRWDFKCTFPT